ncbi:hypothetical protein KY311_00965 [Candidatus Woesearchaeota archaeon]|nr:hypothetical protein [Candidatus Woesearchaeota archaeon]MBW3016777.1 hypothetical protein [Candidatus Woesearchaeota archaeon]
MALEDDIREAEELKEASSKAGSAVNDKIDEIRAKIAKGESTGDNVLDFVLYQLHTYSEKAQEPFRKLYEKLQGNAGKPVLVIVHEDYDPVHYDPPKPGGSGITETYTDLYIGVLDSDFRYDPTSIVIELPTARHAHKTNRSYRSHNWTLVKKPITIESWLISQRHCFPFIGGFPEGRRLQVFAGDEVEQYFRKRPIHYSEGKLGFMDTDYVRALNLLGVEAPKDFREKYDKETHEEKLKIISDLEELVAHESNMKLHVKQKEESMGRDERFDSVSITLITSNDRKVIENTTRSIKENLAKALELGMDNNELELELKPGVKMNVPEYIAGLCKQYGVKRQDGKEEN